MSSLRQTLDSKGSGLFRTFQTPAEVAALGKAGGWKVVQLDASDVSDKAGLLNQAASAFNFPDWFGANWDAFADSLTDVTADPGVLVVWIGGAGLPERVRQTALEILAERAGETDAPFVTVVTQ